MFNRKASGIFCPVLQDQSGNLVVPSMGRIRPIRWVAEDDRITMSIWQDDFQIPTAKQELHFLFPTLGFNPRGVMGFTDPPGSSSAYETTTGAIGGALESVVLAIQSPCNYIDAVRGVPVLRIYRGTYAMFPDETSMRWIAEIGYQLDRDVTALPTS